MVKWSVLRAMLLIALSGCASYNPTAAPTAKPDAMPVSRSVAAVTAAADPYVQADRQKATFDASFAVVGVLPIQLFVRNGSERPLVIRPSDVRMRLAGGAEFGPSTSSGVVARLTQTADHTGAFFIGGIFGLMAADRADEKVRTQRLADYRSKSLQEVTLRKDESAHGFVFFIPPQGTPSFDDATLRARFIDADDATSLVIELPLTGLGYHGPSKAPR